LRIRYYTDLLYKGEKFGNFETLPVADPLAIYNAGVAPTKNLYNFMDTYRQDLEWKPVEYTYRDSWSNK